MPKKQTVGDKSDRGNGPPLKDANQQGLGCALLVRKDDEPDEQYAG
jgi:hypothetical protein